ncbi:MAG: type VI secretion system-associated protein TagF [Sandarakinorhabdus sp.]|jgi:type VI secretion system protein ImpM
MLAGLYGKLPAHGDFIWRGWPDALVARIDAWLTDGVAMLRSRLGEDGFGQAMQSAPLWHCWLALDGEWGLHGVVTPTVDSAGRLFLLLAGVAGPPVSVWAVASQQPGFAAATEAAAYDALAGDLDADALYARLAAAVPAGDGVGRFLASLSCPTGSAFWVPNPAAGPPVALPVANLDAASLARLVEGALRDAA